MKTTEINFLTAAVGDRIMDNKYSENIREELGITVMKK
jgi:hypothetical protein